MDKLQVFNKITQEIESLERQVKDYKALTSKLAGDMTTYKKRLQVSYLFLGIFVALFIYSLTSNYAQYHKIEKLNKEIVALEEQLATTRGYLDSMAPHMDSLFVDTLKTIDER